MFRKVTVAALALLLVVPALAVDTAPDMSDAEGEIGSPLQSQQVRGIKSNKDLGLKEQNSSEDMHTDEAAYPKPTDDDAVHKQDKSDWYAGRVEGQMSFLKSLDFLIIAAIFALISFVIWDRHSFTKPLERRLSKMEKQLFNLAMPGSMHELARQDPQVKKFIEVYSSAD